MCGFTQEFHSIVIIGWQREVQGVAMFKVVTKLKLLKKDLKRLNQNNFFNIEHEADEAHKKLKYIQEHILCRACE